MIDVIELIPSRDMRQALREEGRQFTDMEKASLIHNLPLPPNRRRELLQDLAAETEDERLRAQLGYALEKEQRQMDWFRDVSEGCVFGVQICGEDYPNDSVEAYFATFETAFKFGCGQDAPFKVCKWRVLPAIPPKRDFGSPGDCGFMKFDADGSLVFTCLWETGADESLKNNGQWAPWPVGDENESWPNFLFFEDRWVDLPNLYELGDFVRVLDDRVGCDQRAHDWAMVEADPDGWESFRQRANVWLADVEAGRESADHVLADFSDMQVPVEVPCKDGTFVHYHINPMFLERWTKNLEDSDDAELMQMAQWIARGECSLDWASQVFKKRIEAAAMIESSKR